MEDTLKSRKYTVSVFTDFLDNKKEADIDYRTSISSEDSINTDLFKKGVYSPIEDSSSLLSNIYRGRDVIHNEKWSITETIQGKIVDIKELSVFVDCLVDLENRIFQHRAFPKNLFENILNLTVGKPIIIKTHSKPGAIRIDVFAGDGIVNLELFRLNEGWSDLNDSGLDNKLIEW